ncbi:matrixin family metalloprotease [Candidatus Blastococcus massiliensis]|uniref:matrixin family metalloprotease n=1 Tax=Candidatus Blastococcus massiliensis TaxID=1470358 RepID=UPI00058ED0AD|nr:matrixin family metalloprotease [Candidatus Blastococcus massiliensis]
MDQQSPGTGDGPRPPGSGHVPQWVVDEAARLEEAQLAAARPQPAPTEWRSWPPPPSWPPAAPARRPPSWRWTLSVVLVVVLCLGGATLVDRLGYGGTADPTEPVVAAPETDTDEDEDAGSLLPARIPGFPTPPEDVSDTPLGVPQDPPAGGGPHAFLEFQGWGDEPVAYDPCRPIRYVVRPDNAPAGGQAVIESAVRRISEVTGLQFVYEGATAERPVDGREPYQPDVYGDRWAPVVIAWETTEENPDFLTDMIAEAGSQWVAAGLGPHVYVTGGVSLDAATFDLVLGSRGGEAIARAVVIHELAHLVGLDHVDDPTQLMHPVTDDVLDLADGDLTGLSALGRGRCVPGL